MRIKFLSLLVLLALLISCLPVTVWAATALPSNAVKTYLQFGDYISVYPAKHVNGSKVTYTDFSLSGENGGDMAGEDVHMWKGGTASKWLVRRTSDGSFALATSNFEETQSVDNTSGLFFWDIESKSTSVGANIHVWADSDLNDISKLFYLVEDNDGDPETFFIASYYTLSKGVTRYLAPEGFFSGTSWATDGCNTVLSDKGFPWRIHIVSRESGNALPTDVTWMDSIPNCTPLSSINIPGTHDSAATNTDDFSVGDTSVARCQKLFLDEQLYAGIRALDIRLGYNNNTVTLNHSMVTCYHKEHGANKGNPLTLDYALSTAKSFLAKYPSETVIFVIKRDSGDNSTIVNQTLSILNSYKNVLYDWAKDSPTLGDVRGKIVVMSRLETSNYPTYLGPDLRKWDDNYNDSLHFAQKINTQSGQSANAAACGVWVQDDYSCSTDNKKLQFLNTAKQLNGKLGTTDNQTPPKIAKSDFVFNYNSLSSSVHVTTPLVGSRTMNSFLLADVANQGFWNVGSRMGIVMLDFADKSIAQRIIDSNKKYSSTAHTYTSVVTKPTCTASGYTTYTCSICGYRYTANTVAALGHNDTVVVTAVTCTTDGYTTRTCSVCKSVRVTDRITAPGHSYKSTITVPTCTEGGFTTYKCSVCNDSYIGNEVSPLGHKYVTAVTPPSCTSGGYTAHTCSSCGDYYCSDEVAPVGHSYDAVVTAPTCTEEGFTTYTCSACKDSYVADKVAPTAHVYAAVVTAPTCTQHGYTTYTCENCGRKYTADQVEPTPHNYSSIVTAPTCTQTGFTTYTCDDCGHSYVGDQLAPLSHNYDTVTTDPTCTEVGYTTYTCAACGHSYTADTVSELGHDYIAEVIEPTCTQNGSLTYTCSICNDTYVDEEIEAFGHDYLATMIPATCTEKGYTTYTCTLCNDTYTADEVEPAGHDYIAQTVYPTCTEYGYTLYTCCECSHVYQDNEVAPYDHDYIAEITPATCTQDGFTTYTCAECGDFFHDDHVEALGHDYVYTNNGDETHLTTCSRNCGYSKVEACIYTNAVCLCGAEQDLTCKHKITETKRIEPTCTTDGSETVVCTSCGIGLSVTSIPAKGHSIVAVAAKPATCTESGFNKHWFCSSCNGYFADSAGKYSLPEAFAVIAPIGHSYDYVDNGINHSIVCTNGCTYNEVQSHLYTDGICICGATENVEPSFDENLKFNMDISAGAEMVVNYNFMASVVSKYADFYLEVSKNVAGGDPVVTTYGVTEGHTAIDSMKNPATGEALIYNAAYTGINAKEMGDSFSTTLYAIDASGKVYRGETVVSSIKDFLLGKLNDEASIPEMKTMAVDMLKYGAAAQVNFDYDVENLVIADLSEEQLALATKETPEAVDYASVTGEGANVNTNITVNSKVELSLSCIAAGQADPAGVKCVITDQDGKVLAELATENIGGVMYKACYSNVGAKEMRKVITATFYNTEGTAISKTVNWSVESYVAQTRARADATETEIAMVNAMLTYGDSVAAYMAAQETK